MSTTLRELDPGFYALEQEMVRAFLIVGDERALLVDAGGEPFDVNEIVRSVTPLPCDLFFTHCDGDHTASHAQFEAAYCHADDQELLLHGRDPVQCRLIPVEDGHVFDLGGRRIEVLHIPGHTPGHCCLLCRDEQWLISGDCVSYDTVFLFGPHRDPARYRSSLDDLAALRSEFSLIYPCHGPCPIPVSAVDEERACYDAWASGELSAEPADFPFDTGGTVLRYSLGNCSIFIMEKE